MAKRIAVIVGSLRKESFNRKMAKALVKLAPESLQFEFIEIGTLPLYNQDLDDEPPRTWTQFRTQLKTFDAVLFATPEYNRSVPGVLKNAIDVGSRPYGKSAWEGKPCAVISVSPGAMGGFGANIRRSGFELPLVSTCVAKVFPSSLRKTLPSIAPDSIRADWFSIHDRRAKASPDICTFWGASDDFFNAEDNLLIKP